MLILINDPQFHPNEMVICIIYIHIVNINKKNKTPQQQNSKQSNNIIHKKKYKIQNTNVTTTRYTRIIKTNYSKYKTNAKLMQLQKYPYYTHTHNQKNQHNL